MRSRGGAGEPGANPRCAVGERERCLETRRADDDYSRVSRLYRRTLLLPLAFDLLFFPLLLKTWRIQALIVKAEMGKSRRISDRMLELLLLTLLVVDFVLTLVWVEVDGPVPTRVFSKISPPAEEG